MCTLGDHGKKKGTYTSTVNKGHSGCWVRQTHPFATMMHVKNE
jgi:hypothetical protein